MKKIYIWGAGHYIRQVIEEIDDTKVIILGIIDNDKKKQGMKLYGIPVISPMDIIEEEFDHLIISVKRYEIIENECKNWGIDDSKIISYWKKYYDNDLFKERANRVENLLQEIRVLEYRLDSAPYEWNVELSPRIREGTDLLKKIINDHSSLCRFGDGEFELIREKERPWFQKPNAELSKRLKEVLMSENSMINIAIAQNFTKLEKYKEKSADIIREYMFGDTRKNILRLLDKNRIYYDTYVTRPYIIFKDKKNADEIFPLFKEIWKGRDVVIIEGEFSRIGVGNDLMEDAESVSRILCPSKNAWDKYEDIFDTILKIVPKGSLICISLGPSATVLAYDLAGEGYQALDIGQLDNEYEWYIRDVETRVEIPGKMVAEISSEQTLEIERETEYFDQIIAKII